MKSARCRFLSAFIEQRNLAPVRAGECRLEEPGGKLWSIRILGAKCPLKSMTSVAASHCLVASAELDPAREIVL